MTIYYKIGNDYCDETCQMWAEGMGAGAFVVDAVAAGLNIIGVMVVDASFLVNPTAGGAALLAWKTASLGINVLGTMGTVGWTLQGLLLGANGASGEITFSTEAPILIDNVSASVKLSQDTIASGVLDLLGWAAPEPHSAAGVSSAGVAYDLIRNPTPSILSYDPIMPSWFDFAASFSSDSSSGYAANASFGPFYFGGSVP